MANEEAFTANRWSDGVIAGPMREPRNLEQALKGSIHDDRMAQKLGLRGGTVAGERVAEGTASVGKPDMQTPLRERLGRVPTPKDLRILSDLEAGQQCDPCPTRAPLDRLKERLSVIVEPLPDYEEGSEWGGPIAPPSLMVGAMTAVQEGFLGRDERKKRGVGLWGAIELQHLRGPVFVERDYQARAAVLAVGETPKTEYVWYESILADPKTGDDVASMLMMLRFMKASHPAWQ
jgi:hypothetical protein